jgi:hypothetical protein
MQILLALTFVFGVLLLLTMTKIFSTELETIFLAIIPHKKNTTFHRILHFLGVWFFYFSLVFQAWYWLFGGKSITF